MRKFSKKQIGAVGLVVIMSAQGPVMAAEVAQEETASEVSTTEIAEQETERIEDESVEETQVETIVESTEESESESESEEAEIESESALESTESENAELDETAEAAYAEAQAAEIGSAHISCWYQNSNGTWYYYDENGNSVSYKAMTIDGKIYYFGGDGMVANDLYYLDGNAYLADASGARVLTKGWYWQKGYWYYVNEDGSLYIGLLNDGGHTYKMNPVMVVNQPFFTDDDRDDAYAVDENGYVIQCADGFMVCQMVDQPVMCMMEKSSRVHGSILMETGTILEILASWKEMVLQRLKINDITSIPMESWQQMDGFTVVSGIMRMHLENLRLAIHGLMERCIILTKMEA